MLRHVPTCPLVLPSVSCGFPSPADEAPESSLNLHEYVVAHPAATFFVRASGESMEDAHILSGDILVVDRSRQPHSGSTVVAYLDGEFFVKKYHKKGREVWLRPCNPRFQPVRIDQREDVEIWGVVTFTLHQL